MSKVVVTGSNGLLGSAIKRELFDNGEGPHIFLTRKDANLESHAEGAITIYKSSAVHQADTLIHCAAKVGGVQANMDNNEGFFVSNTTIDFNVLHGAANGKIQNLVSILSTCVFPDNDVTYPLTADQIDMGAPHGSNYGYAYSKRLLLYQTKIYAKAMGLNWISVIPTNLYGPHDNFDLNNGHLIPALIRKAYEAKRDGTDYVVWGDGTPLRQFVYSEDMAKIVLWASKNWKSDVPMMAVNPREYSIKEVVDIITQRFQIPEDRIIYDQSKPNGQFKKTASSDVEWFEFTPLEEGINKTIDWFIVNYEKARGVK